MEVRHMPTHQSQCTHTWRITKYDPALRNEAGHYTRTEWTFFAQVGDVVGGSLLTFEAYGRVEDAYVAAAMRFVAEADVAPLQVAELEESTLDAEFQRRIEDVPLAPEAVVNGGSVQGRELEALIRLNLREALWCKLLGSGFYIHFGWDYYMYIGSRSPCSNAIASARQAGLFVEE